MPATQTEASGRPAAHRGELLSSSKQVYPSAGLGSQRQAKVNKAHSLALNDFRSLHRCLSLNLNYFFSLHVSLPGK